MRESTLQCFVFKLMRSSNLNNYYVYVCINATRIIHFRVIDACESVMRGFHLFRAYCPLRRCVDKILLFVVLMRIRRRKWSNNHVNPTASRSFPLTVKILTCMCVVRQSLCTIQTYVCQLTHIF